MPGAPAFLQAILQDGARFDPEMVAEAARLLSKRAFIPPAAPLPDPFNNLTAETYGAIRHRPERRIWADDNRSMVLEPLHRGFVYAAPVAISLIEDGIVRRVVYDPNRYQFGRLTPSAPLPDMGFSGFRLLAGGENGREIASFQGAAFFRSAARGQGMGALARGLAIKTGDVKGEEFPVFRAFWIDRPTADGVIVIYAIADSESATASFRFTLRANDVTILDTEMTIFARAALDHVGIAPMQASFYFSANRRRSIDDYRPAVHEVNGLQMLNGRGEWIWRPLSNPEQLQISSFMDENPRGFGLIQRERDFAAFNDDDQRYELRPSLWIEPIGDWGAGNVQLIEIPSESEVNDNIIAFWRPKAVLAAGSETPFAYRQFWSWTPPERPPLAQAAGIRIGRGSQGRRRRFLVEFAGDMFTPERAAEFKLNLSATPGQIIAPRLIIASERRSARVLFDLDPGSDNTVELRLLLESGEKPVSETWLYRWTP
ncbi:MAG: glucan biosynthesis protein [Methylocystis sp.]|nr:glucan biosynthesis protein [Methylocystis sp.]MCA3589458.1 glucan biosynthesis protein [Methylocystis sp.]MCA3590818.1 glucan biosynthesis protein [Methylocystis sp.]